MISESRHHKSGFNFLKNYYFLTKLSEDVPHIIVCKIVSEIKEIFILSQDIAFTVMLHKVLHLTVMGGESSTSSESISSFSKELYVKLTFKADNHASNFSVMIHNFGCFNSFEIL